MITSSDLVTLPYTSDLTRAGILHACQILARAQHKMPANPLSDLRSLVVNTAVDLAFRRYLAEQEVPYQTLDTTPFSQPGHHDVILGRRRCIFLCFLQPITTRSQPSLSRHSILLQKQARAPGEYLVAESHFDPEIFIFAFIFYLSTPIRFDPRLFASLNQPIYLLYPMPTAWARPRRWESLGFLHLEAEAAQAVTLEMGGLGKDRQFLSYAVHLQPRQPLRLHTGLYTLAYLALPTMYNGRIRLYSSAMRRRYLPSSDRWGNLWVQGSEIVLAGYMTRGEFRQRAQPLPQRPPSKQSKPPYPADMAVFVEELYPIQDLLQRAKEWHP